MADSAPPEPAQMAEAVEPVRDSELQTVPASDETLMDMDASLRCNQCDCVLEAENLSARKNYLAKLVCKGCKATTEMLRRNLGTAMPSQWDLLNKEEQTKFWKECLSLRDQDGALRYKAVRALLTKHMVTKVINTSTSAVGGQFRPLSFYERQGYCTEDIEEKAESRICPVVGLTYLLPVVSKEESTVRQDIESTILQCEQEVKRRKVPEEYVPKVKKAKKGEPPQTPVVIPLTDEQLALKNKLVDLTALASDSEDEARS